MSRKILTTVLLLGGAYGGIRLFNWLEKDSGALVKIESARDKLQLTEFQNAILDKIDETVIKLYTRYASETDVENKAKLDRMALSLNGFRIIFSDQHNTNLFMADFAKFGNSAELNAKFELFNFLDESATGFIQEGYSFRYHSFIVQFGQNEKSNNVFVTHIMDKKINFTDIQRQFLDECRTNDLTYKTGSKATVSRQR